MENIKEMVKKEISHLKETDTPIRSTSNRVCEGCESSENVLSIYHMGIERTICTCPACRSKLLEKAQQETDEIIREARKSSVKNYLEGVGIAKRYLNCSLDNFQGGEKYVRFCREYLKKPDRSLFFTGVFGCGKTHLAAGICRELILAKKIYFIKFITGAELLLGIRSGFTDNLSEAEMIDAFTRKDFLFIDDLGAEKTTEWSRQTFSLIVDRRDRDLKPTIITSNLSLDQIEEKIDGRVASRIANGIVVNINLPDYRKKRT